MSRNSTAHTQVIVVLCRHGNPIGARVHTEDAAAYRWIADELDAGVVGIDFWSRQSRVTFCDECLGGAS